MATTKRRGFSLMELLAVVTIVGILAAIVVPRVSISSQTASDRVEEHQLAVLNSLVEQHYLETDDWPANLAALTTLPDGVPVNPNGKVYSINATTHRVEATAPGP